MVQWQIVVLIQCVRPLVFITFIIINNFKTFNLYYSLLDKRVHCFVVQSFLGDVLLLQLCLDTQRAAQQDMCLHITA
jgi:hypothetical protein